MLGNHLEANQELEQIPPELWTRPDVMEVRWHICAHTQNWDACLEIGKALVDLAPDHAPNWPLRAFALRRAMGGSLQTAWDGLLPAAGRFPKAHLIPFDLACYACQMGRLPEARE